tara:strand:- start:170 stop:991 length:822 start_codon:yes stop_codon:yes gene_type:complete
MRELVNSWQAYLDEYKPYGPILENREKIENELRPFLQRVFVWGKLTGESELLGVGTKGVAYRFGTRVLKITYDLSEAIACSKIIGKDHPNVYDVHKAGRLKIPDTGMNIFVVIYDYLESPSEEIREAADVFGYVYGAIGKMQLSGIIDLWNTEEAIKTLYVVKEEQEAGAFIIPFKKNLAFMANAAVGNYDVISAGAALEKIEDGFVGWSLFSQILEGREFLRKNGVIFFDIHEKNVMMGDMGQPVIIDIGYSQTFGAEPEIAVIPENIEQIV